VALTRKAGDSLENITRTVSNIQSMNQQIAAAAEQQSAVAEEISRSIINVRDVSEQTAAASDETAASALNWRAWAASCSRWSATSASDLQSAPKVNRIGKPAPTGNESNTKL
jgi:methyl-accepting chemotaxis protein